MHTKLIVVLSTISFHFGNILKAGQIIRVDGANGIITLLE